MSCPHHNLCTPKQPCSLCSMDNKNARIATLEAMLREAGAALVKSPCVHGASSPEACVVAERVMFGHAKCLRCRALTKLDQSGLLPKEKK